MHRLYLLLFIGLCLPLSAAEIIGTNLVSQAERFAVGKDYKLGPTAAERSRGKYDCTTFVQAVLKEAGFQVNGEVGKMINIVLTASE